MLRIQKATLVLAVLVLFANGTRAAGPIKVVKVAVSCSGDDAVGSRICASLKEKIRASKSFELEGEEEARKSSKSFHVILISEFVDDEHPSYHAALAVIFTRPMPEPQPDGFVTAWVAVVGDHKIDEEAATIMAELDNGTESLRR
jgi:transcriptional regulator GlxA family with amidase domain